MKHSEKQIGNDSQPDFAAQILCLPFPYLLVAPDNLVSMVNPAAENFLRQSAKALQGNDIALILRFEDERVQRALHDADANMLARMTPLKTQASGSYDVDIAIAPMAKSHGWRIVTFSEPSPSLLLGSPHKETGTSLRVQSPDILAHEIKNPLAGIKGAAQLLERKLQEKDKPLTQLIRTEVERIAKLVDQMQSLGSRTVRAPEPCNIYEILAHARAVAETAQTSDVIFHEEYDPSLPTVGGARDALAQIFLNLFSNAIEACQGANKPQITITTRYSSGVKFRLPGSDKARALPIEVTISDNGPGVSDNIAEHLFSPFVTSKTNGQGLGLALVQKLVTDMQGRVYYERDVTHGLSHFRLLLPSYENHEDMK